MDLSQALQHQLSTPLARGKRVLDLAGGDMDGEDGLIWLARWRRYGFLEGLDLLAVITVLDHPVMKKSTKNANAQMSTVL